MTKQNNIVGGLMLVTGAIIGAATALFIHENRTQPAGKVLEAIRENFPVSGKIVGSWIDYDPMEYHGFDTRPLVYIGGLSIETDQGLENYQFAADVYTGDLVDYFKI